MSIFDSVNNKVSITATGTSGGTSTTSESSGQPGLGTAMNNAIQVINGNKIDTAFLDALYTANKLSSTARDAILAGGDPSVYGLIPYDLYVLTVGRLGARLQGASAFPLVPMYAPGTSYPAGQMVMYQLPFGGPGLYQALQNVPGNTPPTSATHWSQLASGGSPSITVFNNTATYQVGQVVIFQPTGTQNSGLYFAQVAPPVGTLPTATAYWAQIISPGPVVLLDADLVNPALAGVSAPSAGILAQLNTNGTALSPISIPSGRRYRLSVGEVRPNTAGGSSPTDCHFRLELLAAETYYQDGTISLVITPRWSQIGTANAQAIAAQSGNLFVARARVELL